MIDALVVTRSEGPPAAPPAPAGDVSAGTAAFLRLVADPTRRRIFLRLMAGELCNCEMVDVLDLPQNLISHHLRQLREAGLVSARRDADDQRWIYYRVNPDALASAHAELAAVFTPQRLGNREPVCGPAARRMAAEEISASAACRDDGGCG